MYLYIIFIKFLRQRLRLFFLWMIKYISLNCTNIFWLNINNYLCVKDGHGMCGGGGGGPGGAPDGNGEGPFRLGMEGVDGSAPVPQEQTYYCGFWVLQFLSTAVFEYFGFRAFLFMGIVVVWVLWLFEYCGFWVLRFLRTAVFEFCNLLILRKLSRSFTHAPEW